jgi:predicted DCC family thiol-disulfide oxidoreductase YuxK
MAGAPLTVLYDRDCGFCRTALALILRLDRDGALLPEPIQGARGQALLAGLAPELRLATAHVVTADGTVTSGGDAAPVLAARVPALRPFAPALRIFAAGTRAGYGAVVRHRHRLGPLIPAEAKARADRTIARHRAARGHAGA